jgi:hypothetical protein
MVQRPPDSDDPTSEEEVLELDGSHTDQLDDTYRVRVVTSSESDHGAVGFDDRGNSQWKWKAEQTPLANDTDETFDELKALDNPALCLEDEGEPKPLPPTRTGYDPYATGAPAKAKVRR